MPSREFLELHSHILALTRQVEHGSCKCVWSRLAVNEFGSPVCVKCGCRVPGSVAMLAEPPDGTVPDLPDPLDLIAPKS